MAVTKLTNLVDPEVMAEMIDAKLPAAIVVTPIAKIDTTLAGAPGSQITVPKYEYVGDATDVLEGAEVGVVNLTTGTETYKVKKAAKDVGLTDEAVLAGYGDPVGQTGMQITMAIAAKVSSDALAALQTATLVKTFATPISYDGIVDTTGLFQEEVATEKVGFVHPDQVTTLRKDENFKSKDIYGGEVVMRGEIGMIAGVRMIPSKKVVVKDGVYRCPIVQLTAEPETDDATAALTIFIKRDTNVETERDMATRTTKIGADKHYVAALTDESKVVIAEFTAAPSV